MTLRSSQRTVHEIYDTPKSLVQRDICAVDGLNLSHFRKLIREMEAINMGWDAL